MRRFYKNPWLNYLVFRGCLKSLNTNCKLVRNGYLTTILFHNFPIINCPHLDSNTPTSSAYVFILFQFMRYDIYLDEYVIDKKPQQYYNTTLLRFVSCLTKLVYSWPKIITCNIACNVENAWWMISFKRFLNFYRNDSVVYKKSDVWINANFENLVNELRKTV
jgi:hypothetical protein